MIKRTIEISSHDIELNVRDSQIVVSRAGVVLDVIPAEDIGILIVDTPRTYYSHATIIELMNAGAVVVLCGKNHHPVTVMLPLDGNSIQTERMRRQIEAREPLKKRLWQKIVRHKICLQRENLEWLAATDMGDEDNAEQNQEMRICTERIKALERETKSGDPGNCEGQAARLYWSAFFGPYFRRNRDGDEPNNLLNYGYMIMRAAVARAIVSAGLHPSIGIFHRNRYDTFCLADDIVEVLRPIVDRHVWGIAQKGCLEINRETKTELLELLTFPLQTTAGKGPLLVALERTAASLNRSFEAGSEQLELPLPCW